MAGRRSYFAYGSNMDESQMSRRCPGATLVATARLPRHRFLITARGFASVVPDASSVVHGLVWALMPADERNLDRYEGARDGLYGKTEVTVESADGLARSAFMYVATERAPGRPKAGYLEQVVAAAQRHGLPQPYVEELRGWMDDHGRSTI